MKRLSTSSNKLLLKPLSSIRMATEIEFFNKELTLVDLDGGSYIVCAECNERR